MLIVVIFFIVALLIGIPLAFVMGGTGIVHLLTLDNELFLQVIPQRLFMGVNNITLTCLPFFIIAGQIMNVGGITKKLMDAARELVGHLKGGLAYTPYWSVWCSPLLLAPRRRLPAFCVR